VLADTSKEGRTLSIFLACLEHISGFGRAMLGGLGVRVGSRGRISTFTEVVLAKANNDAKYRPDGLIVVNTGKSTWTALVEAKVGTAKPSKARWREWQRASNETRRWSRSWQAGKHNSVSRLTPAAGLERNWRSITESTSGEDVGLGAKWCRLD
jgi:hypothetical protein